MPSEAKKQVAALSAKATAFAAAHGETIVLKFQSESVLLLEWLNYVNISQRTGVANTLLDGASSSVREAAACLALGLVRPAMFALRTQIDLILAWLYFKDHPMEWQLVNERGEGFKLKREILDYLGEHYKGFAARFAVLKEVAQRSTDDPYRLLSAHIHAQSNPVLPIADDLADVVYDEAFCTECTVLAREACEFMNDLLVSVYASKWTALPDVVKKSIDVRLASGKKAAERFFVAV